MTIFDWIVAVIVVVSLIYVSFVLTLAEWLSALRKGQAVTLLPERGGWNWPMWTQIGTVIFSWPWWEHRPDVKRLGYKYEACFAG